MTRVALSCPKSPYGYAVPAFLLAVVAARVDGSASFVAARRLKRLLEPLTNSSSAARSVTLSSEAMSFSDFARVAVFATIAFEACVVFAIFVFSISCPADATRRRSLREPATIPPR
jgi:hypothetical protein